MINDNYPSLYRYADSASLKAQNIYLLLHKVYLGTLVLGSVTSTFSTIAPPGMQICFHTGLAIILIVGLLLLWGMRARQDDKTWFDGRAVAESVKTVAWRFMMKVHPFDQDSTAETNFLADIKEIREARPHLAKHFAETINVDGSTITNFMKEKRASSLDDRRNFYISARINDQKAWYANKAKSNLRNSARWFWVIALLQVAVVILAIVQVASGGMRINSISFVTTLVAAMTAWNQMKRHDELAQSYALAAQELEEIGTFAQDQASDPTFSQLVEQAENSISREHTMWCARRDIRLSKKSQR